MPTARKKLWQPSRSLKKAPNKWSHIEKLKLALENTNQAKFELEQELLMKNEEISQLKEECRTLKITQPGPSDNELFNEIERTRMRRRIVRSEAEKEECFMRLEETERYIETVIQKNRELSNEVAKLKRLLDQYEFQHNEEALATGKQPYSIFHHDIRVKKGSSKPPAEKEKLRKLIPSKD